MFWFELVYDYLFEFYLAEWKQKMKAVHRQLISNRKIEFKPFYMHSSDEIIMIARKRKGKAMLMLDLLREHQELSAYVFTN